MSLPRPATGQERRRDVSGACGQDRRPWAQWSCASEQISGGRRSSPLWQRRSLRAPTGKSATPTAPADNQTGGAARPRAPSRLGEHGAGRARRARRAARAAIRSGRRAAVRCSAVSRRQRAISRVVARQQHLGDLEPAPRRRLRVHRVLQQPGRAVRLLDEGLGVADDAGQQPADGLDDDEGRDLAAVQHVVADGELGHRDVRPVRVVRGDPRVDALVPAAGEAPARTRAASVLGGRAGVNGSPDGVGTISRCAPGVRAPSSSAAPHGVGAHDHAGAPAERGVVDRAVPVRRPVAQVVHAQVEQPGGPGLADERERRAG